MNNVERYLQAATRANTRKSYLTAVRHYEVEWGGFLPATSDSLARYLADHAEVLSISTLRQRLTALAKWHRDQGFPDPTKAQIVREVFRGILATCSSQQKQARPLFLEQIEQACEFLDQAMLQANKECRRLHLLRLKRNKALLLLGFWRGFRGDELTRLKIEDISVRPGEGMTCYLSQTKVDRQYRGTTFKVPALVKLCPVAAYLDWTNTAQLSNGAVFRPINRWGLVGAQGMHVDSIAPLLRSILLDAGIASSELYSSHSLRRGFANWAISNGWDIKALMSYIGWKDANTAIGYVEATEFFSTLRLANTSKKI